MCSLPSTSYALTHQRVEFIRPIETSCFKDFFFLCAEEGADKKDSKGLPTDNIEEDQPGQGERWKARLL
jgi:hypothetical protein